MEVSDHLLLYIFFVVVVCVFFVGCFLIFLLIENLKANHVYPNLMPHYGNRGD